MAIRTISYSVKSDGISPNTEQQAGLQSEHAVTQLVFTLDNKLYQALLSEKQVGDTLVYRFDCCDSMGGAVKTEPKTLTGNTVTFTVGENLTRSGGKARVYLVVSRYNSAKKTETELLSFPAKLRFENVPETDSDNGNSRESLSTLTEAAKDAANRARMSANTALEAQGKTETARLAIEGDSTVVFDGNETYGEMDVDFAIDTELSTASNNAISNKAVATKFENTVHIIESGTSGIWNYRKWSDGTAECWGNSSVSAVANTQWAGYYFANFGSISYPPNLFIEEPTLNCILKCEDFPGHLFFGSDGSKSSTGKVGAGCHGERTISGYLHLTAKGVWK